MKLAADGIAIDAVIGVGPQLNSVRELFLEYASALAISLECQGFDQELASLPGAYAPPSGCLLFAHMASKAAGCVGLRRLDDVSCEMKRLYVRPEYRCRNLGRLLAQTMLAEARKLGYRAMYLDTLAEMTAAQKLYAAFGFAACAPYYDNSELGSRCMVLQL